jgi:hypothetical protein
MHYNLLKRHYLLSVLLLVISFSKLNAQSVTNDFKQWALTPPMGWNSWDCYGSTVTEQQVKDNADYMAKNLKKFGWQYIIVDIRWFVENDYAGYNQRNPIYNIDEYGRYQPAVNRFPSAKDGKGFKALADYIHKKGLKFGIHIMRGIPKKAVENKMPVKDANGVTADQVYTTARQCAWLKDNYTVLADKPGAQEYYNSIFQLYASWGVDFVKIDDLSAPDYHGDEIDLIRRAIDNCKRPIVLSTSPGATPLKDAEHISTHANMWRMVNDVWDNWRDVTHLMKVAQGWYPYIAPGTWPDCDMIPLGHLSLKGEGGKDRMTRLTKDEQYSLITLFSIFRSPLFFGGDMPGNDAFTLSLLTNKSVLKMHNDASNVHQLFQKDGKLAITSKDTKTGAVYLALFNISDDQQPMKVGVDLADLDIKGKCVVENMWENKNIGSFSGTFERELNSHACGLYKITVR